MSDKLNWQNVYDDAYQIYASTSYDSGYDVIIYRNRWAAIYNPPKELGGYLSSSLQIESRFGSVSAGELKANCQFDTKEEAMAVCERHHGLMILR